MTPDELLWVTEAHARIASIAAATSAGAEGIAALTSQISDLRRRLDAVSIITAQIGVQAGVAPQYLVARKPELANGEFISAAHIGFDYDRVLASVAAWNTEQERMPGFDRYDSWFRVHGRGVSIIVPSYNDHRVLSRCLTSLKRVKEGYSSVRVIVADDASPSPEHQTFLNRIEHEGVLVVHNAENGGFARNVNSALALVGGGGFHTAQFGYRGRGPLAGGAAVRLLRLSIGHRRREAAVSQPHYSARGRTPKSPGAALVRPLLQGAVRVLRTGLCTRLPTRRHGCLPLRVE